MGSQFPGATGRLSRLTLCSNDPVNAWDRSETAGAGPEEVAFEVCGCVTGILTRLATSPSIFCSTCEMRLLSVKMQFSGSLRGKRSRWCA
jgi:hypothetical protein